MDTQFVAAPACLQEAVIASAGPQGPLQHLIPPDPLHPLVIHGQTFQPETPVDQSANPANMTPGQLPDAPAQRLLVNRRHRYGPALSVAVLTRLQAGSALGHTESILQNADGSPTLLRAQKLHSAKSNGCAGPAAITSLCPALHMQEGP